VVQTRRSGTVSGYFDDHDRLAEEAAKASGRAPAVYVTANPVRSDLLARAGNRVKSYVRHTTNDAEVVRRRWLLLDFDPVRPADISSSDAEHAAALARAQACVGWLVTLGLTPDMMILADSGNGGHVVVRVDLPNDDASRELISRCLAAVASQFTDVSVKVDVSVANAARIWKLYGTLAAKGDSTPDRPHRLARIVAAPEAVTVAPRNLLEQLAALAPRPEPKGTKSKAASDSDWAAPVRDGVEQGQRNDAVARLAGYLFRRRPAPHVVLELVRAWNANRCRPPLTEDELLRTVDSIAGKEARRRRAARRRGTR
jgi:hypothetical protein